MFLATYYSDKILEKNKESYDLTSTDKNWKSFKNTSKPNLGENLFKDHSYAPEWLLECKDSLSYENQLKLHTILKYWRCKNTIISTNSAEAKFNICKW